MRFHEYTKALKIAKLLYDLDGDNPYTLIQDYHQMTRITLLAQDYPLAKLYVQGGLELNQADIGLRLLDIYTLTLNDEQQAAETALTKLNGLLDKKKREEMVTNDLNRFKTDGLSEADIVKLRQVFNR